MASVELDTSGRLLGRPCYKSTYELSDFGGPRLFKPKRWPRAPYSALIFELLLDYGPGRHNHRLCLALGLVRRSWSENVLRSLVDGDGWQTDGEVMGCVLVKDIWRLTTIRMALVGQRRSSQPMSQSVHRTRFGPDGSATIEYAQTL